MNPGEVTPEPVSGGFAQSCLVLGLCLACAWLEPSGVMGKWPFLRPKSSTRWGIALQRKADLDRVPGILVKLVKTTQTNQASLLGDLTRPVAPEEHGGLKPRRRDGAAVLPKTGCLQ